jgi:hypothetical protein
MLVVYHQTGQSIQHGQHQEQVAEVLSLLTFKTMYKTWETPSPIKVLEITQECMLVLVLQEDLTSETIDSQDILCLFFRLWVSIFNYIHWLSINTILHAFVFIFISLENDLKCPICHKIVPSDDVEVHLVRNKLIMKLRLPLYKLPSFRLCVLLNL